MNNLFLFSLDINKKFYYINLKRSSIMDNKYKLCTINYDKVIAAKSPAPIVIVKISYNINLIYPC